jgi:two-component system, OmpR family, sensor histidine kinase VicK
VVGFRDVREHQNEPKGTGQGEKPYHELVDTIDGIVWEGDARTLQFVFVSQQAERILGYPAQQWIDEPSFWKDHIFPADREWVVAYCDQATKEKKPHQFEYRMIAADGRMVWLRDIVTVIVEDDLPVKLRGVMIDITRRKAAEEKSQQNLERIRALNEIGAATGSSLELDVILEALMRKIVLLLPYAAVLVWLMNEETDRLERSACLNIDREYWMGRELTSIPPLVKSVVEGKTFIVARNVQTDPRTLDRKFYKREGIVSYLGVPLVVKEKVLGVLALLTREDHDFSSDEIDFVSALAGQTAMAIYNADLYRQTRIQASELSKANRAISDFTAMIAHDLRSPLVSMIGISEMMKDGMFGAVNEEQIKWLGKVMENGSELVEMISDFLDVSKLESGRISLTLEEVDLEKLLSAAFDNHFLLAQKKQIVLQKNVNPSTRLIQADARRLEQVVNNLLSNALKFTPAGGEIQLESAGDESNAKVWVRDTGIGIAADEIGNLFEKYKQTTSGKSSNQKGTGLGLVICKMIVEAHGGRIWVESAEGKGTTFAFTLPNRRASDTAAKT